jgi:hypothetical protein
MHGRESNPAPLPKSTISLKLGSKKQKTLNSQCINQIGINENDRISQNHRGSARPLSRLMRTIERVQNSRD